MNALVMQVKSWSNHLLAQEVEFDRFNFTALHTESTPPCKIQNTKWQKSV